MKNYMLHTPEGVKDFLDSSSLKKYHIQQQVLKKLLSYGYELIETPTFEYLNVFISVEKLYQNTDIYKWVNRQGEIVALRSDMTKSIARVVATQNSHLSFPQRYAYMANSFRYSKRYQGKSHEFTQGGVELIGDKSLEGDAEIIQLAIETLIQIGVKDFVIHIGSASFLESLIEESGLNSSLKKEIYEAIFQKDAVHIEEILNNSEAASQDMLILVESMQRVGSIELIQDMRARVSSRKAQKALEGLEDLYNILKMYGGSSYILFDLSILSYASYYTSMMFQVFTLGIGSAIAEGGRYDKLLSEFGKDLPAVGFGLDINLILQKLEKEVSMQKSYSQKILIVFEESARSIAKSAAQQFRTEGVVVQNWLNNCVSEALEYAQRVNISKVLYFEASDKVNTYDIENQTKASMAIDQLVDTKNKE